jgi:hypothetical protein
VKYCEEPKTLKRQRRLVGLWREAGKSQMGQRKTVHYISFYMVLTFASWKVNYLILKFSG